MEGFQAKKKPLLCEKQRKVRLRFAKKYPKLTAEDWLNFLFIDKCPKYIFQYPLRYRNVRNILAAFQVKQSAKMIVWGGMTGRVMGPQIYATHKLNLISE